MVHGEQVVTPLAPSSGRARSDDVEPEFPLKKGWSNRSRCLKCCGGIAAIFLIQAVVIVVLIFTVFRVKDPKIKMDRVIITRLELVNGTVPKPGVNMSLIAEVSVKNPNIASFKYSNTTTTLYYHGAVMGEARGPPGRARPRRTTHMNITVDVITDRLLASPSLTADVSSGLLTMSSYSRIPGRVKILKIIRKHVVVRMNCTMTVNISSQAIQEQKCKRHVNL